MPYFLFESFLGISHNTFYEIMDNEIEVELETQMISDRIVRKYFQVRTYTSNYIFSIFIDTAVTYLLETSNKYPRHLKIDVSN